MKYLMNICFIFFITYANTAHNRDFQYFKENNIVEESNLKLYNIWDKIYNRDEEISQTDIKTLKLIEAKAYQLNNSDIFYNLGVVYMNISDSFRAEKWMAKAAELLHPYAFHNIGWWYDHGFGHIEEDKSIAARFYNIAFWELGVARSGTRIAEMIFYDEVAKFDTDYAIDTLSHLLSQSDEFNLDKKAITYASFLLGRFYFELHKDDNQKENLDNAIKYFKEASAENNIETSLAIAEALRIKYHITNDPKYNEEAKLYYLQASGLGSAKAMIFLGNIYLENYQSDEEKIKGLGWILTGYSTGKIDRELERKVTSDLSKIDKRFVSILRPLVVSCHEKKYKNCFLAEN